MNAIKPYAHIADIDFGVDVLKKIEWVGRTCYKSTDKITDESAPKFVEGLIKRGHEAMVEHGSFCFEVTEEQFSNLFNGVCSMQIETGFKSFLRFTAEERFLVSGNVRAWRDYLKAHEKCFGGQFMFLKDFIEGNPVLFPEWQQNVKWWNVDSKPMKPVHIDDLKSELEFLVHCDITVRFVVDRGISHEIVRHRPASFAQESTRYCNYANDKFGGQVTFILPEFLKYGSHEWKVWKNNMERSEQDYMILIKRGVSPEKARGVLGTSLKTEVIMTASCGEWKHFFELRACNVTGKAHPQILEVSRPLLDEFKNTISVVFDDLAYE